MKIPNSLGHDLCLHEIPWKSVLLHNPAHNQINQQTNGQGWKHNHVHGDALMFNLSVEEYEAQR